MRLVVVRDAISSFSNAPPQCPTQSTSRASWGSTQISQRRFSSLYTLTESGPKVRLGLQGINFLDIFPIFRDPAAFESLITNFLDHLSSDTIPKLQNGKIDVVVALDARGFLLGPIIASRLKAAFAPVRKVGKLPGECVSAEYEKEYGKVRSFFGGFVLAWSSFWCLSEICL